MSWMLLKPKRANCEPDYALDHLQIIFGWAYSREFIIWDISCIAHSNLQMAIRKLLREMSLVCSIWTKQNQNAARGSLQHFLIDIMLQTKHSFQFRNLKGKHIWAVVFVCFFGVSEGNELKLYSKNLGQYTSIRK